MPSINVHGHVGVDVSFEDDKKSSEEVQENPPFQIDTALNKKGFAEFLALYDDVDIVSDEAKVAEAFEVFNEKDALIETSRKIIVEQIGKEIGKDKGLELSKDELGSIDKFLTKQAIEEPEKFLQLVQKAKIFERDTRDIGQLEAQLKRLGVDIEKGLDKDSLGPLTGSLKEKLATLSTAKSKEEKEKIFSFFIGTQRWERPGSKDERLAARDVYGVEQGVFGGLKNIEEHIALTKGLLELKELRTHVIEEIFPASVLGPVIKKKIADYTKSLTESTQLKELEKAHEFLKKAKLGGEEGVMGIDYLEEVDEASEQDKIDKGLSKVITDKVNDAVAKSSLGDQALSRLEKSLQDFVKRESLGSKDKEDYKKFLNQVLEEQLEALKVKPDKAKALLLKRIIIKINA